MTGIRTLKSPGGNKNPQGQVLETLIIGGVPFHVIHKESHNDNNGSCSAINTTQSINQPAHPIYETIDEPQNQFQPAVLMTSHHNSGHMTNNSRQSAVLMTSHHNSPSHVTNSRQSAVLSFADGRNPPVICSVEDDRIYAELENPGDLEDYSETVSYQCCCEHNSSRISGSGGTSSETASSPCSSPRLTASTAVDEDSGFRSSVTNSSLYSSQRYNQPPVITEFIPPPATAVTATITSRRLTFRTSSTRSTASSRRRLPPTSSFNQPPNSQGDFYANPYQPTDNSTNPNAGRVVPNIELAFNSSSPRRKSKYVEDGKVLPPGLLEVYLEPTNSVASK